MQSKTMGRVMALLKIAPAFVFLVLTLSTQAMAADNAQILTDSCNLLMSIKVWLFRIVYILGAIGLVIIAVSAFLGRFKFAHLIALGGGLFIVAMADLLITFISSGNGAVACS